MIAHPDNRTTRNWKKLTDNILKRFIPAYVKSMNKMRKPPILVDAFAGPGIYKDGSKGSPIIMLETVRDIKSEAIFIFMEKTYAKELEENTSTFKSNFGIIIIKGDSQEKLLELRNRLDEIIDNPKYFSPSPFLYLDPWGLKGINTELIFKFLELRRKGVAPEILLRFPPHDVYRFLKNPKLGEDWIKNILVEEMNLDQKKLGGKEKDKRYKLILTAYIKALRQKYYKEYNQELYAIAVPLLEAKPSYYLVFLTEHPYGCVRMSEAMTKALFKHYKEKSTEKLIPDIEQNLKISGVIPQKEEVINFINQLKNKGVRMIKSYEFASEFNTLRIFPAFLTGVRDKKVKIQNLKAILEQLKEENIIVSKEKISFNEEMTFFL